MTLKDVKIIELPKILDPRGNLSFIEEYNHIPFKLERTYWIYDVPGGEKRGGHAFKNQQEMVVALSGSFDVIVPNGLWRYMANFSTNSVVLVLSSTAYDASDYIRDFNEFKRLRKNE
jgi:hypothetical protein